MFVAVAGAVRRRVTVTGIRPVVTTAIAPFRYRTTRAPSDDVFEGFGIERTDMRLRMTRAVTRAPSLV